MRLRYSARAASYRISPVMPSPVLRDLGAILGVWNQVLVAVLVAALLLAACASHEPSKHDYDPQATELYGRIVDKRLAHTETHAVPRNYGEYAGVFTIVNVLWGTTQPSHDVHTLNVYEYLVQVDDGRKIAVQSEFFGHDVGECVKVFLSERPSYPRLTSGTDCKN
jgi:hypothetical protein